MICTTIMNNISKYTRSNITKQSYAKIYQSPIPDICDFLSFRVIWLFQPITFDNNAFIAWRFHRRFDVISYFDLVSNIVLDIKL